MKKGLTEMKKLAGIGLLLCGLVFSGFVGLDLRPTFSYEIFSSPYYRILKKTPLTHNANIGFLPVYLDTHAQKNPTFSDARLPELMLAMNGYLEKNLALAAMPEINLASDQRPDLFLGSVLGPQKPMYILADCPQEKDYPEYCLRIGGQLGSKAWMQQLKESMATRNLEYVLVCQLGEGYIYPNGKMKQVNKLVETRKAPPAGLDMGTNFWLPMSEKLVALNKPIDVLFVKGMLINKEGKVLRLGAEGITAASKASFLEQVVNISHEFSEEELNAVQNEVRRNDLPHAPLSWQIATEQLVKTLTAVNLNTSGGYIQPQ